MNKLDWEKSYDVLKATTSFEVQFVEKCMELKNFLVSHKNQKYVFNSLPNIFKGNIESTEKKIRIKNVRKELVRINEWHKMISKDMKNLFNSCQRWTGLKNTIFDFFFYDQELLWTDFLTHLNEESKNLFIEENVNSIYLNVFNVRNKIAHELKYVELNKEKIKDFKIITSTIIVLLERQLIKIKDGWNEK